MLRAAELTWKNCELQDHRDAWKRRWTKLSGAGALRGLVSWVQEKQEGGGRQLEGGVISDDMIRADIIERTLCYLWVDKDSSQILSPSQQSWRRGQLLTCLVLSLRHQGWVGVAGAVISRQGLWEIVSCVYQVILGRMACAQLVGGLHELIYVNLLEQCVAQSKCSLNISLIQKP